MEFVEIVSEIKLEPESFHMDLDTSHDLSDEPLVGTVEVGQVECSTSISSREDPDEDQDDMYDNFCDRIQQAVEEGEAEGQQQQPQAKDEDQVTPKFCEEDDVQSEQPSPASDDVAIHDSGGVFKDHNYSLFKDVNPLDQLLMTYYLSMEKDATTSLSENNQNVCKILELLGTIVSTSSTQMISGAIGMIESHTSQMRTGVGEGVKESPLEKVYSEIEYLRGVRDLGQFLTSETDKLAASLLKQQQEEEEVKKKEPISEDGDVTDETTHSCDHLMAQLKRDVNEKLTQFRASQFECEEIATQTEPPPIVPREEISCQTDPLPEPAIPPPVSHTVPLKYFTSSDMETDSSMSSGAKRKKRRKRKKEMLAEFFRRTDQLEEVVAAAAEIKRKERTKVRVTGSDDEIDRLVNFNNLDRDYEEQERDSTLTTTTVNGPKTEAPQKKKGETVDDILNGIDIDKEESSDGNGEQARDSKTEEKMFLKKLNLEHKRLLLNSSSSEAEQEVDKSATDFEALLHSKRVTVQDSGEDSEIEETVDLFLTDFQVPEVDDQVEKEKRERKRKHSIEDSIADGVEEQAKQRRDSFDQEMAKLLKDSSSGSEGDEKDEKQKEQKMKREGKEAKDKKPVDESDVALPLDLSDTVGKRSRNESLDRSAEEAEMGLLLDKRKQVFLNSQSTEKLDAAVLKAHQSTRNPLLMNRPNPVPSPAVSSVTSRDPDCISVSSSSSIEELAELDANATKVAASKAAVVPGSSKTETPDPNAWTQRNTRKMMSEDKLDINTKKAQRDESERIKRLERKHEALKKYLAEAKDKHKGEIILDVDPKTKQVVRVHPEIVKYLKEHQVAGIKFLYDCAYGSIVDIAKHGGSGCILAHCMGLGKTLQQITVMHTVVQYPELKTSRILVICPKSTVMNWVDEVHRWIGGIADGVQLKVFYIPDQSDIGLRVRILSQWHKCGTPGHPRAGVMLLGHEAFRILVLKNREVESVREDITSSLLHPGPDLVICDEGHVIKNPKSAISQAVSRIRTTKRIVLTGTPIQNNLKEYFCMVSFIKPMFLGTLKEFSNLYANPIKSGQHKDSTTREIKVMQQRSYVLHKKLEKFVQRREAGTLKQFLPEKFEYVIFVPLTQVQQRLYKFFLEQNPAGKRNGKSLISDYTFLRKIWTHPKVLESAYQNAIAEQNKQKAKERERRRKSEHNAESEDDVPDDVLDKRTDSLSVTNDWWRSYLTEYDLESLFPSHKLKIMFEIIKLARENGEKCLIFSAFVAVLNVVEYFMNKIHFKDARAAEYGLENFQGPWVPGVDYYRLDGRTSKNTRHSMITRFNDPRNAVSTFLISAKAGGMGINLTGANRVIILDTSWNPSNDQQNIFRIFRLGQKRNCYVYRLLAMGTMEEKVYSRSVTKQALSYRVVDEQQIDRHYNMAELEELYVLSMPDFNDRPVPSRPADRLLANLVHTFPNIVFKYHIHDSLLENKAEENLSEAEKKEAWFEYEQQERRNEQPPPPNPLPGFESFDYRAMAAQLSGYAGSPGAHPYLSLLQPNDPYLQLMYASQGLPSTSAYNPMLTGGNNYFTSGSLFPPEPVSAGPPGIAMPPSPSGIGALGMEVGGGGKKGHKGANSKPSPFMQSLNFASLSQQLGYPEFMWNGAPPTSGLPQRGAGKAPGIGLGKGNNTTSQQKAPPSPVPSRPGVVRIPTPPLPFPTQRPPIIVAQNHHQHHNLQQAMHRKRPRILTKTPVSLPPSTTIEKLPLNTTQVPANAKAPILPSVPQSITVEKVVSGAKGPPAPTPPQPKPPPNRSGATDKTSKATTTTAATLQPTAVIDLIDDVIDANPGLTVKPIKLPTQLPPGMRRKTVVTGLAGGSGGGGAGGGDADKGKQAKGSAGIAYSVAGKGANKAAPATVEDISFPWRGETIASPQDAAKKRAVSRVPASAALNPVPAPKTVLTVHPAKRPATAVPRVVVPTREQIEARKKAVASTTSALSTVRGALKGILKNPSPKPPSVSLPPPPIQRSATSAGIIRVPPKEGAPSQRTSLPTPQSPKPLVKGVGSGSKAATGNEALAKRILGVEKRVEHGRRWSPTTGPQQKGATTAAAASSPSTATPPWPGVVSRTTPSASGGAARVSVTPTTGVKNGGGAGLLPGAPPALKLADSFISQQQGAKKATPGTTVKEIGKPQPQMKTVSIQQKGSDGSPGQQMPPVRLPVLAMTTHGGSPKTVSPKGGGTVPRVPATQFTLKQQQQVAGAARVVKVNSSSPSPQKPQTQPSPGQAAQTVGVRGPLKRVGPPTKMGMVQYQGWSSHVGVIKPQQSSPLAVGQKRTANVASMNLNLGPAAKKSSSTTSAGVIVSSGAGGEGGGAVKGASASASSSGSVPTTPQQSSAATNLTVIQKNLQKRQNGSFS